MSFATLGFEEMVNKFLPQILLVFYLLTSNWEYFCTYKKKSVFHFFHNPLFNMFHTFPFSIHACHFLLENN